MKRIRFLSYFFVFLLLGSCNESELWQEDDIFCETRSASNSLDEALEGLRETRLGGALWTAAAKRLRMGGGLHFNITFRETNSLASKSMVYDGYGLIYYNFDYENTYEFAQLAIHELFHIYQNGDIPMRILNNEIEAYLIQYLFLVSENKEKKFQAATSELTQCIISLAACIDLNTGDVKSDKYEECYWAAMRALKRHSTYQNTDTVSWQEIPSSDMPNLRSFLKNL